MSGSIENQETLFYGREGMKTLDTNLFIPKSKALVCEYMNREILDNRKVTIDDVYVVWLSKTLQNSKALMSTHVPKSPYFELTYNGIKNELYIDVYEKIDNVKVELVYDE